MQAFPSRRPESQQQQPILTYNDEQLTDFPVHILLLASVSKGAVDARLMEPARFIQRERIMIHRYIYCVLVR